MPNITVIPPMLLNANKDTARQHKQRMERNIVYASISLQTLLSVFVVGFCMHQLNRCPIDNSESSNVCPTALYTNIITATVAMWFPSPYIGIISGLYGMSALEGSGGGARSVKKKTSVEEGIEEVDGNK